MKNFAHSIQSMVPHAIALLALFAINLPAWSQAEPTAMEQKFGVSDSTVLFMLIGFAVMFTVVIITVNDSIKNLAKSRDLWKGKNIDKIPFLVLALLAGSPLAALAGPYAEIETSPFVLDETTFWFLVVADFFLFGLALYYINMLRKITRVIRGETSEEPVYAESGPNWFSKLMKLMTDAVPLEKETEVLTDHDYDGIQELDNNLPPWWKWMFYVTIAWAFVYLLYYHVLNIGVLQDEEYQLSVEQAEAEVEAYLLARALNVDENSVELILDQSRIDQGASIYKKNCVQCHGQGGEGGVGPNLTDPYWIHGGGIKNIFKTVKYGVPAKGMIPWQDQLSPVQMQNVSIFITTLEGSNPPNAKEPQGDLWTLAAEETVDQPVEGTEDPKNEQVDAESVSQVSE